jgi:hypothetical protein
MNILVIGAGFFGTVISLVLSEFANNKVTLVDEQEDILTKASYHNHNRLHLGFHYPRSIETAKQSIYGLNSFMINFKEAINTNFSKYYLIDSRGKTSAQDFIKFCDELNLYYKEEWPAVDINKSNIELSLLTEEPGFDISIIKKILKNKLNKSNINIFLNKKIAAAEDTKNYDAIINCTYANFNEIQKLLNLNLRKLKYQDVIIPIMELKIPSVGITIMDGPFCSLMPFGFKNNQFLLYHVKNSVIKEEIGANNIKISTNFDLKNIIDSSSEYFKFIFSGKVSDYLRTTRVLPINNNDARLTDFDIVKNDNQLIINVLSGKVSTCWDTAYKIKNILK